MFLAAQVVVDSAWMLGMGVAAVATLALLYRWYCGASANSQNDQKLLSYPPMAPVSLWETVMAMSSDDAPGFLWRNVQQMGGTSIYRLPFPTRLMFGRNTPMAVVVGNATAAREIMTDKATIKPKAMYGIFDIISQTPSLFSSNGPYWHARRKGIAPSFSSNHVQRMNAVALAKCDKWIEERLKPLIDEGKAFNVGDEMIDLLLTAISETAFEYTLSPQEVAEFKHELELVLREFLNKTVLNPLRRVFGFLLPDRRRAILGSQRIQRLSLKIIHAYKHLANPIPGTIINLIMSNPCYKNDLERAADVTIMFIAGHDTTAYSLAWTLKEMAMHPQLQSELRQSIHNNADLQAPHQLDSVRHTIREAIRLHPVSAMGSMRMVGRDFVLDGGVKIPAGSLTFLPYICMLRDPKVFGEDYDQFQPSRWEHATAAMNQAFVPFAMGRQNCVGQPLALAELHCMLPRIISQFELTVEEPGTTECFLTLKPVNTMLKATPVVGMSSSSHAHMA